MSYRIIKEPWIAGLIALNSLDAIFTKLFVDAGRVTEVNPFMSSLLDHGDWQFLAFKLLTVNLFIYILGLGSFHAEHPKLYGFIVLCYTFALGLHLYSIASLMLE